jgi:dienelactone hydrolase
MPHRSKDYALTGQDDIKALVSLHGGLSDIPGVGPEVMPKLLILSGGNDDTSTEIIDLENTLTDANGTWEISRYSGIEHAFTVFNDDRYNVWADVRSWYSMTKFLAEAFGIEEFEGNRPAAFDVTAVNYTDVDGAELTGYLAKPAMMESGVVPAVVILPDWDGVNTYEKERATLLAESGYIAFAADIYGSDLQEDLDIQTRINLTTTYRDDPDLFNQRIQRAVDLVKGEEGVDVDHIAVIGYCFGGTGVLEYAFSGTTDVVAVVSFHGGHQTLPQPMVNITPYVLVLSGGVDDAHGNQTEMEAALNERNADWEITRYAKVGHGYTSWTAEAYNLMADARSWDSMMSVFANVMPVEGNRMEFTKPDFEAQGSSGAMSAGMAVLTIFISAVAFMF